jgi:hypothetical protein
MRMRRRDMLGGAVIALWAGEAQAQAKADWVPDWLSALLGKSFRQWRRGEGVAYITPEGAGARDGTSWKDAGRLGDLGALILMAGPGGEVRIAADLGPYRDAENIELRAGGAEGRPVLVHGVASASGAEAPAEIYGSRAESFTRDAPKGRECFRLLSGADHLSFRGLSFHNIGNGCFRVGAPIRDLTIEDCAFRNVYRFIENTASGDARDATLTGFAVRRCAGEVIERSFARLRYGTSNGRIEACRADSQGVLGDPFAVGCALEGEAHDIAYVDCVMENFRQVNGAEYWNGDGFSDEYRNANIRYLRCAARGSTDGGFDCKSQNLVMEECFAEDNKRNFRVWSHAARLTSCTSRNPNWRGRGQENGGPCHVWVGGEAGKRIVMEDFTAEARDIAPIFVIDADDLLIDVRSHRFDLPEGAPLERREGGEGVEIRVAGN